MNVQDEELKTRIRESLYMHGKLALVFYETMGEYIVKNWGSIDSMQQVLEKEYAKLMAVGFEDEARSLTLLELPDDENLIFSLLACGSLKSVLKEHGLLESHNPNEEPLS